MQVLRSAGAVIQQPFSRDGRLTRPAGGTPMFLGHFAVAFAAKRKAPEISLGTLFVAAQLPDVLWPMLVLAGVEQVRIDPGNTAVTPLDFVSYPYSHSLLFDLLWAALFALAYAALARLRRTMGDAMTRWPVRAAFVTALAVLSHWVLDAVSHRPDVPVLPHGPYVGLGLWNSWPATFVVEGVLFAAGILLYARATRARGRAGTIGLAVLVATLIAAYLGATLGPPPPSVAAIAWGGLAGWLFVALAVWVDRRRQASAAR
jgi:hypothetical protein